MFKFWGSQEQEQARPQDVNPAQSWYPPSLVTSATPTSSTSSSHSLQRPTERTLSPSPAEAAAIITLLKDKSADDLRKLLSDKDAYHQFLLSLDQVKIQNNIRDELCKETLQLASELLCRIIRTTELAAAQEKLNELEKQKEELLRSCSPASLLQRLQEAMNETEEESEAFHRQFLHKEIDPGAFVQKYKKLRTTYHKRALIHLAAKAFPTG
uniref:VPS37 C-terminal domain-containing protein n=1 Tax=Salix viminalis TaxID=40686 RepID=A0A6N2KNY5_SALVM